jgi:hypothetical protein
MSGSEMRVGTATTGGRLTRATVCGVSAGVFLAAVLIGWHLDAWSSGFFDTGWSVVAYNALRLILLCAMMVTCIGVGQAILGSRQFQPAAAELTLLAFFGSTVVAVIGVATGRAGMLTHAPALAITSILLAIAVWQLTSFRFRVPPPRGDRLEQVVFWAMLAVLIYVAAVKFSPEHTSDAIIIYQPYYQEVLDRGRIEWPTAYASVHFVAKNAGLPFLYAAVSDLQSFELASILYVGLTAASLSCAIGVLAPQIGVLRWIAVLLYIVAPHVAGAEFFKLHASMGALAIFQLLALILLTHGSTLPKRTITIAAVAVAVYQVLLATSSLIFAVPVVGAAILTGWLCRRRDLTVHGLVVAAAYGVGLAAALGSNYLETGVIEIVPWELIQRWVDVARIPDNLLLFYRTVATPEVEASGSIPGAILYVCFGNYVSTRLLLLIPEPVGIACAALYFGVILRWALRASDSPVLRAGRLAMIAFSLLLLALQYTLFNTLSQIALLSLDRLLWVSDFVRVMLFLALLMAAGELWRSRRPTTIRRQQAAIRIAVIVILVSVVFRGAKLPQSLAFEDLRFVGGLRSISSYYDRMPQSCFAARSVVRDAEIVAIYPDAFGCQAPPASRIKTVLSNSAYWKTSVVLLAPPEQAREELQKENVDFFLVDLTGAATPRGSMLAISPLFAPETLATYFGLFAEAGNGYVLTWRERANSELPPDLVDTYAKRVAELRPAGDRFLAAFRDSGFDRK